MAERPSSESGKRVIKSSLKDVISSQNKELVVKNEELASLIDRKMTDVAKSGMDPAALDVDVTIRW